MSDASSIPLGIQQVNPMQSLASMVGVAGGIQGIKSQQLQMQGQQQQNTEGAISLKERQAASAVLSDPANYTGEDGQVDFNKALPAIMKVAPTTGMTYIQHLMTAQQNATTAQRAISAQTDENRGRIGQVLYGISQDANPEIVHKTLETLAGQYKGMEGPIGMVKNAYDAKMKAGDTAGAYALIQQAAKNVLPQQTQQSIDTGAVSAIPTAGGTQLVQTSQGAAQPQGAPIGQPMTPPNQIITAPNGAPVVANAASGHAGSLNGGDAPMVSLPSGESMDTYKELQGQRTAAQQNANQAPVLHDINREIKATLSKGTFTTGATGQLIAKMQSVLGVGSEKREEGASDYDILGKMLERSALTAAQGMGPQTNAGLEAQIKANGSQAYNPTALKKIANLNDALVTGSEKYRDGLEKSIQSSPNTVFAKRQFDQQWAANADPMALRLLNAAKSGDKDEVNDIFRTVGGPRSQGGNALRQKLLNLKSLSETGQLQ
jgi:hypothetical protein